MENQETWEPTFTVGYTLSPKSAYGGGVSTHPSQGPAYPSRWPTSDTSAAPISAVAAATVAPTLNTESARRSSGSRSVSGVTGEGRRRLVRGSRSIGGGNEGAKERLNAMAYNNAYVEGQWALFRHAGAMRLITRKAILAGAKLPASLVEPTCKA